MNFAYIRWPHIGLLSPSLRHTVSYDVLDGLLTQQSVEFCQCWQTIKRLCRIMKVERAVIVIRIFKHGELCKLLFFGSFARNSWGKITQCKAFSASSYNPMCLQRFSEKKGRTLPKIGERTAVNLNMKNLWWVDEIISDSFSRHWSRVQLVRRKNKRYEEKRRKQKQTQLWTLWKITNLHITISQISAETWFALFLESFVDERKMHHNWTGRIRGICEHVILFDSVRFQLFLGVNWRELQIVCFCPFLCQIQLLKKRNMSWMGLNLIVQFLSWELKLDFVGANYGSKYNNSYEGKDK